LMDHSDATVNAVRRAPKGHGPFTDLHIAAIGDVGAAENLKQRRFARAVLAHQRMNGAGMSHEADVGERLDARKDLADGVEPQAPTIIHMCIHESLHPSPRSGRVLPIVSLVQAGKTGLAGLISKGRSSPALP